MDTTSRATPSVMFQVEKIIGICEGAGNVRTYQVQWAPVWLSSVHLVGCEHLIEEFLQSQPDSQKQDTGTSVAEISGNKDVEHNVDDTQNLVPTITNDQIDSVLDLHPIDIGWTSDSPLYNESDIECAAAALGFSEHNEDEGTLMIVKIEEEEDDRDLDTQNKFAQSSPAPVMSALRHSKSRGIALDRKKEANLALSVAIPSSQDSLTSIVPPPYFTTDGRNSKTWTPDSPVKIDPPGKDGQYRCNACGKAFKYRCLLMRHIPVHVKKLRYNCDFCSKSFARKDTHAKHVALHELEDFPIS